MKLGFVLPDFRGGGAERVFISLLNFFSKQGYEVFLIVSSSNGPLLHMVEKNVRIIITGKCGIKSVFSINKVVRQYRINILIGTLNMAYVVAMCNIFLPKYCKVISRLGNTISEDLKNHSVIKRYVHRLYQYSLIFSDKIIVQSRYMKEDLEQILPYRKIVDNNILIYNPVDIEKITILSKEETNNEFTYNDIVCIGRLERQKDHETTFLAFEKYLKRYPHVKLHILGQGSREDELRELVMSKGLGSNIIFHGHISNPYSYMSRARFLVMSSLYEGFSNVILESVCLSTPAIVTDCPGGNSEIIENGLNGYLFKVGDYNDMYEKMLLATDTVQSGLGVENYSLSKIAGHYQAVFIDATR